MRLQKGKAWSLLHRCAENKKEQEALQQQLDVRKNITLLCESMNSKIAKSATESMIVIPYRHLPCR